MLGKLEVAAELTDNAVKELGKFLRCDGLQTCMLQAVSGAMAMPIGLASIKDVNQSRPSPKRL